MTDYLNFQKVLPLPPLDPNVNEVTALNNNWDLLDSQLVSYTNDMVTGPTEAGQEYWNVSNRMAVWDGSAERLPDDIMAAWSAWTLMPLATTRAYTSWAQLKWRSNSLLRKVQLTGGMQADSSASAFTPGSIYFVNADTAGSIPASMQPIGGKRIAPCATGLTSGTAVVAGGYVTVDKPAGNTYVRLRAQHLGGPGGGNFINFDQVDWWY